MKPGYEPKTVGQAIGYLVEEAGEVLAAAGKSLRGGLDSVNPECATCGEVAHGCNAGHDFQSQPETNQEWLLREVDDLEGAISRFREALVREGRA